MIRVIPTQHWREFLEHFSDGHSAWFVTVHGVTPRGSVDRDRGRLQECQLEGEPPNQAFRLDLTDGAEIYVAHPREVRVQERADGAECALEVENDDRAVLRLAFRATARPEEVDGLAPAEHRSHAFRAQLTRTIVTALVVLLLAPAVAIAQRGHPRPRPVPGPAAHVAVRGEFIFVGGYFYDPYVGPYPWWPRTAYPAWYFPRFEYRADVRLQVTPHDAAVYVDGFYAGIVDDFDGVFQRLLLPPGGHRIVLYLTGYRTATYDIYGQPGGSMSVHHALLRLNEGEATEPPPVAPPVPPPPAGSYRLPRTPPPVVPPVPVPPTPNPDSE